MAEVLVAGSDAESGLVLLEGVAGELPWGDGPAVLLAVLEGEPWYLEGSLEPGGAGRAALRVLSARRVEERRETRVAIPGARVTLRGNGIFLDCPVLNISAGGLQIRHGQELPPGTRVGMLLRVPLLSPLEVGGRVVWTRQERFGMARSGILLDDDVPAAVRADLRQVCQFYALLSAGRRQAGGEDQP